MARSMEQSKAVFQSMVTLASAALGLVCALVWNESIKSSMKAFLGEHDRLTGLFTYAILATVVAVIVLTALTRASFRVGESAAIEREAEG